MLTTGRAHDLLHAWERAESLDDAESALDALAAVGAPDGIALGDLYDQLAEEAADRLDLAMAVRAQRAALHHGCEHAQVAREMLGWYLLKDGHREAGEAEFAAVLAETGEAANVLLTLGSARLDAGHPRDALDAFDRALAAAREDGESRLVERARAERRECRYELGLPVDAEDRRSPRLDLLAFAELALCLAWFPRDEHRAAVDRWPDLLEDLEDADIYCRRIERHLHEVASVLAIRPAVAPLRVDALVAYGSDTNMDPGSAEARSAYAAELHSSGESVPWPPGRNDACWCGSGRKYKRCCGA